LGSVVVHVVYSIGWLLYYVPIFDFVGSVRRIETMHQLLRLKSKFPNHFAFTLGITCSCHFGCSGFNVDVNYSYIYLVNYSCSLQCIEKIYLTKVILVVGVLKDRASRFYRFLVGLGPRCL
jgi:hypothetical protein